MVKNFHILSFCISFGAYSCATTVTPTEKAHVQDQTQLTLGNQYARDGLLREATEAYKKALAKDPNNPTICRNLGIVLVKAGDFPGGITYLEKSMTAYDSNFDANFYLAEAYRADDKYAEAIYRYKNALKIQPDEPRTLKSLAWSYYKIRFYSESLTQAQKLQSAAPSDEQASIIMARTLLKLKRENEALVLVRRGIEHAGTSSQPFFQSVEADILQSMGRNNDAIAIYRRALKTQPMLAGSLLGIGRVLLEQGKNKEAIEYLERAVHIKPKLAEGHYYLARALEEIEPQRAIRYFAYFKKLASSDPELVELVQDARKRHTQLSAKSKLDDIELK